MEKILYTVIVYTENMVGLLNQIAIIFTRRHINIESLTVSKSSLPGIHKFTITVETDKELIIKVIKQIEKRIDVLKAFFYTDNEVIYEEVALYKIPTDSLLDNPEIENLMRTFNARIVEVNRSFAAIEMSGSADVIQDLFDQLNKYKVLQFVRSGRVAITRSTQERLSDFLDEMENKRVKALEACKK
jgi:acetolactate synthase I/III small subunit